MSPVRSPGHLRFIRSLPCIVCALCGLLNSRNIQACHAPGSRGMGQKRSDLDTIPMCRTHHDYQHSIGWPVFIRKYQLDIPEFLKALTEKLRFTIRPYGRNAVSRCFVALYRDEEFMLRDVDEGLAASLQSVKSRCREHLIDTLFRPLVEKQRAG